MFAPTRQIGLGDLSGNYGGVAAGATVGVGLGANVLYRRLQQFRSRCSRSVSTARSGSMCSPALPGWSFASGADAYLNTIRPSTPVRTVPSFVR